MTHTHLHLFEKVLRRPENVCGGPGSHHLALHEGDLPLPDWLRHSFQAHRLGTIWGRERNRTLDELEIEVNLNYSKFSIFIKFLSAARIGTGR